jgi:5-methylcytosine-specific restriction enzyme subunit McrC
MKSFATAEYGRVPIGPEGLTGGQAKALLRAARAHPLANSGASNILYERNSNLHACQMVGVIAAPECSLEILPKVDPDDPDEDAGTVRGRLVQMLDVALDLRLGAGEAARIARNAPSLLDILIRIFANELMMQVRRGLPKSYLACEDDLPALRGRLDIKRQFTVHAVRPDRLACRYDVLSHDTALLQLMKACVVRLGRYARSASTRRLLDELRILLADVRDVAPARVAKKITLDRRTSGWRSLLTLARLLLGKEWQDTHSASDAPEGISLLFPMNDLFEAYVAALARRALAPWGVEVKSQGGGAFCLADWCVDDETPQGRLFATRPDIMLSRNGRPLAIVDTKWKAIGRDLTDRKRGVAQADVYQMMAYAQLYRTDRLMLLYPHHRGLDSSGVIAEHQIAVPGGAKLDIATVDVAVLKNDCVAALAELLLPLANSPAQAA